MEEKYQYKTKVASKGYTITVDSWENDGDYSNTKSVTTENEEEAKALVAMAKLCRPSSSYKGCIGNMNESRHADAAKIVLQFMKEYPILAANTKYFQNLDDKGLVDLFFEISYDMLGSCEHYVSRVMEKVVVTYSPEDIYVEQIIFK